jgi:hypothetical protein
VIVKFRQKYDVVSAPDKSTGDALVERLNRAIVAEGQRATLLLEHIQKRFEQLSMLPELLDTVPESKTESSGGSPVVLEAVSDDGIVLHGVIHEEPDEPQGGLPSGKAMIE